MCGHYDVSDDGHNDSSIQHWNHLWWNKRNWFMEKKAKKASSQYVNKVNTSTSTSFASHCSVQKLNVKQPKAFWCVMIIYLNDRIWINRTNIANHGNQSLCVIISMHLFILISSPNEMWTQKRSQDHFNSIQQSSQQACHLTSPEEIK